MNKTQSLPPLKANGDLSKNWCAWRKDFIEFLKKEDPKESFKDRWGIYLWMFIGPIGQEAFKTLCINSSSDKDNFDVLIKKLDLYFLFEPKKLQDNENISEYVNSLMEIAIKSNHCDAEGIVKEKVIYDIIHKKPDADFQKFLQPLNLSEIISEWISLKNFSDQTNDKCNKKQTIVTTHPINNNITECIRCGTKHTRYKCPAHGKQCSNCKKFNHFTEKCKSNASYIENCTKCGTGHKQTECPAFGYACTKCGKNNHYSWKCQVPIIRNCSRCGTDHVMSLCPAQGKVCSLCKKPNHLETKCANKKCTA